MIEGLPLDRRAFDSALLLIGLGGRAFLAGMALRC